MPHQEQVRKAVLFLLIMERPLKYSDICCLQQCLSYSNVYRVRCACGQWVTSVCCYCYWPSFKWPVTKRAKFKWTNQISRQTCAADTKRGKCTGGTGCLKSLRGFVATVLQSFFWQELEYKILLCERYFVATSDNVTCSSENMRHVMFSYGHISLY